MSEATADDLNLVRVPHWRGNIHGC